MKIEIKEPRVVHSIYDGVVEGKDVVTATKVFSQNADIYRNGADVDPDMLMYTVYSYGEGNPDVPGNLYWGLTVLEPVQVHGECNMTRGHFHCDRNCAEVYFGAGGEGLLILMDEKGNAWAEKIFPGSLHLIDGKLAHRVVNTGDVPLKVGACWPTTAGHDYEATQKQKFPFRIFKRDEEIIFEKD